MDSMTCSTEEKKKEEEEERKENALFSNDSKLHECLIRFRSMLLNS